MVSASVLLISFFCPVSTVAVVVVVAVVSVIAVVVAVVIAVSQSMSLVSSVPAPIESSSAGLDSS